MLHARRKMPLFYSIFLLFVIVPLWRLIQSPGLALRSVDMATIFASGMALGALLVVVIVHVRSIRSSRLSGENSE